ncbi:MAG: RecQ family ATP-dependent DNA helicase [Caldilineaceae bacterium]
MTGSPFDLNLPKSLEGIEPASLLALSADWRDRLLHYLQTWGSGDQLLSLVRTLREAHSGSLSLMDWEARALADLGRCAEALDLVERRLRRSPALAAMAVEVEMLQATGKNDQALHAAEELILSNPGSATAVSAAAAVLASQNQIIEAQRALDRVADEHPDNLAIILSQAEVAFRAGDHHRADEYLERLGAGIPSAIEDHDLVRFSELHKSLGHSQSVDAAATELERRRLVHVDELLSVLAPLAQAPRWESVTADLADEMPTGDGACTVSDQERRIITLEAARYFGFSNFRPGQIETIAAVMRGESMLVVMPTGAGKSLCYQLPALLGDCATLVISPLIALMKDQVENLPAAERRRATFINSTLSDEQMEARMQAIAAGRYKLIYAAPERMRHLAFLHTLRRSGVSLFVIDEAHCISLWGHDFRPDYLFLRNALRELGSPTALAMTATAPPRIRDEILGYLSYADGDAGASAQKAAKPRVLALDIFRQNLHLSALRFNSDEEKLSALKAFVLQNDGSGIVYANSRRTCESIAYELRASGVSAEAYHAGLDNRAEIQDRFMSGQTRCIVATVAFGMGIDKSDIRFIVHFHPSRSLASYYQEVGRAGRDGELSQGVLFYSSNDWSNLRRWAKADEYSIEFLERVVVAVASQLGIDVPFESGNALAVAQDHASQLDEQLPISGPIDANRIQAVLDADETSVRVALSILERVGVIARDFDVPDIVEITLMQSGHEALGRDDIFTVLCKGLCLRPGESAVFKVNDIAKYMQWRLQDVEARLLAMEQDGLVTTKFQRRRMLIHLVQKPADLRIRLERLLAHTRVMSERRIDDMISYATAETCRHGMIGAYLGSRPIVSCHVCDNCTGNRPDILEPQALPQLELSDSEIAAMIIDCLVSLPKAVGRHGLARILVGALRSPVPAEEARHFGVLRALGESAVVQSIDELLDANHLRQYDRNGFPLVGATISGRSLALSWREEHQNDASQPHDGVAPVEQSSIEDSAPAPAVEEQQEYTRLQTAIWDWRRRASLEQHRPPYTIMDNSLILAIAEARPSNLDELAEIPGMGPQRLSRYGPVLIDLVRLHPPEEGDTDRLAKQRLGQPVGQPNKRSPNLAETTVTKKQTRAIFLKLQEIRQRKAVSEGCSPSAVAGSKLLHAIARAAPSSTEQLRAVRGFSSSRLVDHVDDILLAVRETMEFRPSSS